jgi:hypothetical protein
MGQSVLPPGIPAEGFIKLTKPAKPELTSEQRAALIRQGNVYFSQGDLEKARRIFFTTGYKDGLSRVGVALLKKGEVLEALRMFYFAEDKDKMNLICSRIAEVIKFWLRSEA